MEDDPFDFAKGLVIWFNKGRCSRAFVKAEFAKLRARNDPLLNILLDLLPAHMRRE